MAIAARLLGLGALAIPLVNHQLVQVGQLIGTDNIPQ